MYVAIRFTQTNSMKSFKRNVVKGPHPFILRPVMSDNNDLIRIPRIDSMECHQPSPIYVIQPSSPVIKFFIKSFTVLAYLSSKNIRKACNVVKHHSEVMLVLEHNKSNGPRGIGRS